MNAGSEDKGRDCRGVHVHEAQGRMIVHQVPAAFRAIPALAELGLLKRRNMLVPRRDLHGLRLPEAEGIHRPAGPRTTRTAMTVAHGLRCTSDLQPNGSAKASSQMSHPPSFQLRSSAVRQQTQDGGPTPN